MKINREDFNEWVNKTGWCILEGTKTKELWLTQDGKIVLIEYKKDNFDKIFIRLPIAP